MVQSSLSDFFFLSLRLREKSCLGLEFLVLIQDEGSRDLMFIPKGIPDFDRSPPLLTLTLLCVCVWLHSVCVFFFFSLQHLGLGTPLIISSLSPSTRIGRLWQPGICFSPSRLQTQSTSATHAHVCIDPLRHTHTRTNTSTP